MDKTFVNWDEFKASRLADDEFYTAVFRHTREFKGFYILKKKGDYFSPYECVGTAKESVYKAICNELDDERRRRQYA